MSALGAIAEIGKFLLEHGDLVSAARDALDGGASKDEILKAIRASMVAASDTAMLAELGPRPEDR